jgi:hypothetical protein
MAMDVVEYEIKGAEMQFVEVELDPGEAAVGEAGSLFFMDAGITMDTVFGDGSNQGGGLLGKLLGPANGWSRANRFSPPFTPTRCRASSGWRLPHRTRARSCRWTCGRRVAP